MKKYSAENVFQSTEIKQKIKETCQKKYGESHHMKVRSILNKSIQTNMKKYGFSFAFHSEESKIKGKSTCKERYGAEFPLQVKEIQEKIRKTCRENLGVDPLQSKQIQDKIITTFQTKYGMDKYEYLHTKYPIDSEQQRQKMIKKYGVEYPMQAEEVKEKYRNTCVTNFGVEHPMQNTEIFNKMIESCFKTKLYTFPSGRVEYCQGYEPQCIEHLLTVYTEADIVVGSDGLPPIWYDNPETGKKSRYYPDAYIISENMVIEVKSWWTFKKDYEKNESKFKRIVEMGFKMVLYICNKKEFIEKRIYTLTGVIVEPANLADIIIVEDEEV